MAWASHTLFYTFEISGGKEGQRLCPNSGMQDQIDLCLLSALAERPQPVQLTWQAVKAASSGVNFSERKIVV
jgi:hypothetical protein